MNISQLTIIVDLEKERALVKSKETAKVVFHKIIVIRGIINQSPVAYVQGCFGG